jgi:hypothetical protein
MSSRPVGSWFVPQLPEGKIAEPRIGRRIHLDVMPTDRSRDEEVERLKGIGATEYEDHRKPDDTGWVTMAEPEGNCSAWSAAPPSASETVLTLGVASSAAVTSPPIAAMICDHVARV